MQLAVEGTDERRDRDEGNNRHAPRSTGDRDDRPQRERRRIDVSDLHAAGIDEFVRSNVDTDAVSLEHRGGRTYLLLED
ncbi:hypothetical protein ACT4ML_00615 [Natrinema sp. LN54]|uniref:hypothetical protein n=1 Tax=Natrinema sp. LN54 TaxID=3458705 RepID=UPI004036C3E7